MPSTSQTAQVQVMPSTSQTAQVQVMPSTSQTAEIVVQEEATSYSVLQTVQYDTIPSPIRSCASKRTAVSEHDDEPPAKISSVEIRALSMARIRNEVVDNLRSNAEKMAGQHIHKLGEAKVGDTVQVPVPDVDRGPGDLPQILALIIKINNQNSTYKLATVHGLLKGWVARNQFFICKQRILSVQQVNVEVEMTLRELNGLHSMSGKQGFSRCLCGGKCDDRRCSCKAAGVYCNSKCHKSNIHTKCANCKK
jgi:hypothetical protein